MQAALDRIKRIKLAGFHSDLGDLTELETAANALRHTPGVLGTDGPLMRLLRFGKPMKAGQIITARSAAHELTSAYRLQQQGATITRFGTKFKWLGSDLDFDIETATAFYECKDWDWPVIKPERIKAFKDKMEILKTIADANNKPFILWSKQPLTAELKKWFSENNIIFIEG